MTVPLEDLGAETGKIELVPINSAGLGLELQVLLQPERRRGINSRCSSRWEIAAARVVAQRTNTAYPMVDMSVGFSPKSIEDKSCPTASAATSPATGPTTSIHRTSISISLNTAAICAPRAILIPISIVRRATAYARVP